MLAAFSGLEGPAELLIVVDDSPDKTADEARAAARELGAGERVKHARMRWTRPRTEGVHQVKAAIMSQDGRWQRRRPGPIPVLELPSPAELAQAA